MSGENEVCYICGEPAAWYEDINTQYSPKLKEGDAMNHQPVCAMHTRLPRGWVIPLKKFSILHHDNEAYRQEMARFAEMMREIDERLTQLCAEGYREELGGDATQAHLLFLHLRYQSGHQI